MKSTNISAFHNRTRAAVKQANAKKHVAPGAPVSERVNRPTINTVARALAMVANVLNVTEQDGRYRIECLAYERRVLDLIAGDVRAEVKMRSDLFPENFTFECVMSDPPRVSETAPAHRPRGGSLDAERVLRR